MALTRVDRVLREDSGEIMRRFKDSPTAENHARYRQLLQARPDLSRAMVLGPIIRSGIVESLSQGPLVKETLTTHVEELERELNYQGTQGLERLLVDTVLTSWMVLQQVQFKVYSIGKEGCTLAQSTYWDRRLNSAQWRFLKATEMLARMRKLLGPSSIQVNIAEKQINVG